MSKGYVRIPVKMEGEIGLGKIFNPMDMTTTECDYKFSSDNIVHTLIAGAEGTDISRTAQRYVIDAVNNTERGATIFDWENSWKSVLPQVKEKKTNFYSIRPFSSSKFQYNVLAIPEGVDTDVWIDVVTESFVLAFGLGQRGYEILLRGLTKLYKRHAVFENTEFSESVSFIDLFNEINLEIEAKKADKKAGFGDIEAYNRVLSRLGYFKEEYSSLYKMFGYPHQPIPLKELCKKGEVTVIEGSGFKTPIKSFIFKVISAGIFLYGSAVHESKPENSFADIKHMVVFETAQEVIKGYGMTEITATNNHETMWSECRSIGLELVAITREPGLLPISIIKNTGTFILHRMGSVAEIDAFSRVVDISNTSEGYIAELLNRLPLGRCIVQTKHVYNHEDSQPVYVQVEGL